MLEISFIVEGLLPIEPVPKEVQKEDIHRGQTNFKSVQSVTIILQFWTHNRVNKGAAWCEREPLYLWHLLTYEEHRSLAFLFLNAVPLSFLPCSSFSKRHAPKKQGTSSSASQRPSSEICRVTTEQYNVSLQRSWYWMGAALLWIAVIIPGSSGTFSDSCNSPAGLQLLRFQLFCSFTWKKCNSELWTL